MSEKYLFKRNYLLFIAGLLRDGKPLFLPILLILLLILVELAKNMLVRVAIGILVTFLLSLFYFLGKKENLYKYLLIFTALCLSSFSHPSNLNRYKDILRHIPYNLYQEPITLNGKIESFLPASSPNTSEMKVRGIIGDSDKFETYKILLAVIPGSKLNSIELGSRIRCRLDASNLIPPSNSTLEIIDLYKKDTPFQFFLNNKTGEQFCEIKEKEKQNVREQIFNKLDAESRGTLALLYASCLGEGGQIEKWMNDLFKNTGLYHLLVVSGFHLGLLLIISGRITKSYLRIFPQVIYIIPEKSLKAIIGVLLTILFLCLCETGKPLIRSAIIAFCIAFSVIFNRQQGVATSLIWSLVILTIMYPFCIFEAGVQLSYGAITGVILGSNYSKRFKGSDLERTLSIYATPSFFAKIGDFFIESFFCSLGAFIFVSPIQYYWFETFSLYSLLFNVVFAVPFSYLLSRTAWIFCSDVYMGLAWFGHLNVKGS